ncbi:MAG TPA: glycosyltransferase, partial [Beutenbergiaceae bacterium]|nr:glycosyltransferase [Beutenbergiaceae bacterium]
MIPNLYHGLPLPLQILYWVTLAFILANSVSVLYLVVVALRQRKETLPFASESEYLWVFFVPALNEAETIEDTLAHLSMVRAMNKIVIVVDDGSDDATPDVLGTIDMVGLHVLRREPPYAQRGKGEVLNHAWKFLHELLATNEHYIGWDPDNVIVIVVDADGRLNPDAPHYLAPHFGELRTGGVQSQVEIYNRKSLLGMLQNVEFSIIGWTFQLARTRWGTANMGGNGQANRLTALDSVGGRRGPWRDKLTEDQDLGLRLMQVGWHGRHEPRSVISQQGVTSLRRLFRQRTRWAQGAWQAISLVRDVGEVRAPLVARADIVWALILPIIQIVVACAFIAAVAVAVAGDVPFFADV